MLIIAICLAILGAVAGSLVSALVWRVHQQALGNKSKKLSILNGRSMCPHCQHQLAWPELIPILSWLNQKGRCRHCNKSVSRAYPLTELVAALAFAASYVWWPSNLSANSAKLMLAGWLVVLVGLLALAIYDLRWQLLPNRLLYPTALIAILVKLVDLTVYDQRPAHSLGLWLGAIAVASGLFWVLYQLSSGKWIGDGDVSLGIISGTLLATPAKSLLMIFLASILGTCVALPGLLAGKRQLTSKIPYGPFLIGATAIGMLFGTSIVDWYQRLLG